MPSDLVSPVTQRGTRALETNSSSSRIKEPAPYVEEDDSTEDGTLRDDSHDGFGGSPSNTDGGGKRKVVIINRKMKKKKDLKCRMKLLSRPWGDDMSGVIGPWMIGGLSALREGEIYDVLCEDRLFYLAKALRIDTIQGVVEWYFPFWTKRHNYTGPFEEVYVAEKGHFTSKSGLSSKNVYLTVFNAPARKTKYASDRHRFEAGQKYDPSELRAPRSIPARRRGAETVPGTDAENPEQPVPTTSAATAAAEPTMGYEEVEEEEPPKKKKKTSKKVTLSSSSAMLVSAQSKTASKHSRTEPTVTAAAVKVKAKSAKNSSKVDVIQTPKLTSSSSSYTRRKSKSLESVSINSDAMDYDGAPSEPQARVPAAADTTKLRKRKAGATADGNVVNVASSIDGFESAPSSSDVRRKKALAAAAPIPQPKVDVSGHKEDNMDVEESNDDQSSTKESTTLPTVDKKLPSHVLLLGAGKTASLGSQPSRGGSRSGGSSSSGSSSSSQSIRSSTVSHQDPLVMLSEAIFECRSLFPVIAAPKGWGRNAVKVESGHSFSEQQLRAIDSFLHLIRTPVFVIEEVKTLLQHGIYSVAYFMEENMNRREEAVFRLAMGILFVCSPHNATMLYPRPQQGATGRQLIDRTARTHFVSGDLSFGQALNLARNLYCAICPYAPFPLPRVVMEDARVAALFAGLVLAASSEELATRLSIAPSLLGVAEGLKRLDIDGAALLQMSGAQLEYCLRDAGISEWDLIKLDLDAFKSAALESQFCPALWIVQIEMGEKSMENDAVRADAVRLLGAKIRSLYETQCGVRFDAPPKGGSSHQDSLAFMCPLLNGISYGAKCKMVEPIIPPKLKASKKRGVPEPAPAAASASHSLIVDSAALRAWDDLTSIGTFKWSPLSGIYLSSAFISQRKSVRVTALD